MTILFLFDSLAFYLPKSYESSLRAVLFACLIDLCPQ